MKDELINRENVLMQLDRLSNNQVDYKIAKGIQAAIHIVETEPDAEPEELCPAGWIISEVRCPHCLEYFDTDAYNFPDLIKCPNCGKDNRQKGGAAE